MGVIRHKGIEYNSGYDDTEIKKVIIRADEPDDEGKSQLYKEVDGERIDIEPFINSLPITDEQLKALNSGLTADDKTTLDNLNASIGNMQTVLSSVVEVTE